MIPQNLKKQTILIIGIVISASFLYLSFRDVDYKLLKTTLLDFNKMLIFFSVLIYLITFFLRGLRSKILLDQYQTTSYFTSTCSVITNYGLNNLLPFKFGDVFRIFYLKKYANIPRSLSFGLVLTERIFDMCTILLLFIVSFFNPSVLTV